MDEQNDYPFIENDIFSLSDAKEKMTAEDFAVFEESVLKIKPAIEFNEQGLRFPSQIIDTLTHFLVGFNIETIAYFVDWITYTAINNNNTAFLQKQIVDLENESADYSQWSGSKLGGLAYAVLNCKDENVKISAYNLLSKYKAWWKVNVFPMMNELGRAAQAGEITEAEMAKTISSQSAALRKKCNIYSLSNYKFTESELLKHRGDIPMASKDYMGNGFRFTDKVMEGIGGCIILFPLEWQAEFVSLEDKNEIEKSNVDYFDCLGWRNNSDIGYWYMYLNTTRADIIGTYAYTALMAKDEKHKQNAIDFLQSFYDWYVERIDDRIAHFSFLN